MYAVVRAYSGQAAAELFDALGQPGNPPVVTEGSTVVQFPA
jgi:hypothetical protein